MRLVQIFDRPCCGPSAARELADYLTARVDAGEVMIEYHDLASGERRHIQVPGGLVTHLTRGGKLPVLAVDGELVATGALPSDADALDLANGKPADAIPSLTLATASGDGCSGTGCC